MVSILERSQTHVPNPPISDKRVNYSNDYDYRSAFMDSGDSLNYYLGEIGQFSVMSKVEEIEKFTEYSDLKKQFSYLEELQREGYLSGSEQNELHTYLKAKESQVRFLREELVDRNLGLVIPVAKMYAGRGVDLSDLIQEGNLGLLKAVDEYVVSKGNKFSTFAYNWIRHDVSLAVMNQGRSIRIPVHRFRLLNMISKATSSLYYKLYREPTIEEIAQEVHMKVSDVELCLQDRQSTLSLHESLRDATTYKIDMIEDNSLEAERERIAGRYMRSLLHTILLQVEESPQNREIFLMRYGLRDGNAYSLRDIGSLIYPQMSHESARKIEKNILMKVINYVQKNFTHFTSDELVLSPYDQMLESADLNNTTT